MWLNAGSRMVYEIGTDSFRSGTPAQPALPFAANRRAEQMGQGIGTRRAGDRRDC